MKHERGTRTLDQDGTAAKHARSSMTTEHNWQFWIDVGGTFTDCVARRPDGTLARAKVLSSGVTKGRVEQAEGARVVDRLRVAYGRTSKGLDFDAIDGKPVHHIFLIVAPPVEISNQYLPVLGKIAQFCKKPQNLSRLDAVETADEFFDAIERSTG